MSIASFEKRYILFHEPETALELEENVIIPEIDLHHDEAIFETNDLNEMRQKIVYSGPLNTVIFDLVLDLFVPTCVMTASAYKDITEYDFNEIWKKACEEAPRQFWTYVIE